MPTAFTALTLEAYSATEAPFLTQLETIESALANSDAQINPEAYKTLLLEYYAQLKHLLDSSAIVPKTVLFRFIETFTRACKVLPDVYQKAGLLMSADAVKAVQIFWLDLLKIPMITLKMRAPVKEMMEAQFPDIMHTSWTPVLLEHLFQPIIALKSSVSTENIEFGAKMLETWPGFTSTWDAFLELNFAPAFKLMGKKVKENHDLNIFGELPRLYNTLQEINPDFAEKCQPFLERFLINPAIEVIKNIIKWNSGSLFDEFVSLYNDVACLSLDELPKDKLLVSSCLLAAAVKFFELIFEMPKDSYNKTSIQKFFSARTSLEKTCDHFLKKQGISLSDPFSVPPDYEEVILFYTVGKWATRTKYYLAYQGKTLPSFPEIPQEHYEELLSLPQQLSILLKRVPCTKVNNPEFISPLAKHVIKQLENDSQSIEKLKAIESQIKELLDVLNGIEQKGSWVKNEINGLTAACQLIATRIEAHENTIKDLYIKQWESGTRGALSDTYKAFFKTEEERLNKEALWTSEEINRRNRLLEAEWEPAIKAKDCRNTSVEQYVRFARLPVYDNDDLKLRVLRVLLVMHKRILTDYSSLSFFGGRFDEDTRVLPDFMERHFAKDYKFPSDIQQQYDEIAQLKQKAPQKSQIRGNPNVLMPAPSAKKKEESSAKSPKTSWIPFGWSSR